MGILAARMPLPGMRNPGVNTKDTKEPKVVTGTPRLAKYAKRV